MMAAAPDDLRASLYKAIPYPPRFGAPDEFASFVEHVITNPYLNGETVRLAKCKVSSGPAVVAEEEPAAAEEAGAEEEGAQVE